MAMGTVTGSSALSRGRVGRGSGCPHQDRRQVVLIHQAGRPGRSPPRSRWPAPAPSRPRPLDPAPAGWQGGGIGASPSLVPRIVVPAQKNAPSPGQKQEWCIPQVSAGSSTWRTCWTCTPSPMTPARPVVCFDEPPPSCWRRLGPHSAQPRLEPFAAGLRVPFREGTRNCSWPSSQLAGWRKVAVTNLRPMQVRPADALAGG